MKTRKYFTALLIILLAGVVSIQAQSARRSAPQERKERATVTTHKERKPAAQRSKSVNTARKVQRQEPQKQRAVHSSRQVQKQQPQRERNVTSSRQVQRQQPQRQRNATPGRQVQRQEPQRERNVTSSRQVQRQEPQRERNVTSSRQVQRQGSAETVRRADKPVVERQRSVQNNRQPTGVANNNNPRSTYNKPTTRIYSRYNDNYHKDPVTYRRRYSNNAYYGGNYYHYFYPTRRVKIHYHYDTYAHNYHVLYYPPVVNIFWTRSMYRDYARWYPRYHWRYNYGYRIRTISIFDARNYMGEVAMVYGRVYATWYNEDTDDYLLFFGGDYPNHQFTIVLPGRVARRFSWRPERYFLGEHVTVTGLITTFEGVPEIIVKNKRQVGLY